MEEARFADRRDAGRRLAAVLDRYAGRADVAVVALPRGGVPVGYEVALALDAPLDICTVRKLGFPGHVELAMGAVASGDIRVINEELVQRVGITPDVVDRIATRELEEVARRERDYRGARSPLDVRGKTVLLVDDGLATGATMRAAIEALRGKEAARLIVAVPVGAPRTVMELRSIADEVVCAVTPAMFRAVGLWYDDFEPTTDAEVRDLLEASRGWASAPGPGAARQKLVRGGARE
jgi:predicted phosphoribosyltransferase